MLANRPDIVREDYMNELCTLQVRLPPGLVPHPHPTLRPRSRVSY